jgi:hypothetical protein
MNWKKAIAGSLLAGLGAGAKSVGDIKTKQAELELGIGKPDWQTKFEAYKSMAPEDRALYIEQKDSLPGAFAYNQTLDPNQKSEFQTFNKKPSDGNGNDPTQQEIDRETNSLAVKIGNKTATTQEKLKFEEYRNGYGLEKRAQIDALVEQGKQK